MLWGELRPDRTYFMDPFNCCDRLCSLNLSWCLLVDACIGRFIAEGGISGTRRRWSASADGSRALNPDDDGFAYAVPVEVSYKGFLTQMRRRYNLRLIRKLRMEGASALGHGATDADVKRVVDRWWPLLLYWLLQAGCWWKCWRGGGHDISLSELN